MILLFPKNLAFICPWGSRVWCTIRFFLQFRSFISCVWLEVPCEAVHSDRSWASKSRGLGAGGAPPTAVHVSFSTESFVHHRVEDHNEVYLVIPLVLFQKSAYSEEEIRRDAKVAMDYCEMANALACLLVDTEHFDEAEPLHREVLELSKKYAKIGRIIYSPCWNLWHITYPINRLTHYAKLSLWSPKNS